MKTKTTPKRAKRQRREQTQRRAVRSVVEEISCQLPEYTAPLFTRGEYRYKVVYGGRGGARSWSMARALLILGAQSPLRILCTRELQTTIKDSVHRLLQDQITLMGLKGYVVTRSEIRHENGTLFIFEGLRANVHTIKSLEGIDICWVEEAERISKESWDVLIPTIRKEGSEIWVSFNPDQEDDSTYQRFVVNTPPRTWILKVNWEDNPFLTKELADEKDYAYRVDAESAEHVWGGELRKVSDAQILRGKWIVEEFTPFLGHLNPDECEDLRNEKDCSHAWGGPYQGMDFGFASDPTAALRSWVFRNIHYVEYEVWKLHLELDDIAEHCMKEIPGFEHYVTRADSSRPDSISYLKRHGLPRIIGAKKGPNSVEDGIAHLRQYEKIVIHPRCTNFKNECKRYSYKVDERSGDIQPIPVDKHNHLIDSDRYALEPMIKPQRLTGTIFVGVQPPAKPGEENGNGTPQTRIPLSVMRALNSRG